MTAPGGPDPFGTAALREAVLTTWRTDPARLRQDANLEEDHARGYYRDRVIVELAQNAADAAAAAGEPGRLLLRLSTAGGNEHAADGSVVELLAANTGAPLTAEGVAALASLRASAKGASSVGRFGVGFSAVRSVSDEITVATRTSEPTRPRTGDSGSAGTATGDGERVPSDTATAGCAGVRFSLDRTTDLLAQAAHSSEALAAVVHRREGELPALRLPFPAPSPTVPAGYTTAVRLHLRGAAETAAVRTALAEVGDLLLLALPALEEVAIEVDGGHRLVAGVSRRWRTVHGTGELDPALLADRPVEERARTGWTITWAAPRAGEDLPAGAVVHAPTPTDEPTSLPAVLIASLPLDPSRRRVAAGPVTDEILARAGDLYAELARAWATEDGDALALVPTGLPAGPIDAALHAAVLPALARTPLLHQVSSTELLAPRTAHAITGPVGQDAAVLAALGPLVSGLVTVPGHHLAAARTLGVELRELAEVVDALPTAGTDPADWAVLYAALTPHVATHREALSTLPVPLADGRTARGPRGLLLVGGPVPDLPGLRLVHVRAVHPTLALLGAREAGAVELLDQPEVREAALVAGDDPVDGVAGDSREDPPGGAGGGSSRITDVVLTLAAQAIQEHGAGVVLPSWLAGLPLPSVEGERLAAADLSLPGSWAAATLDALTEVDHATVERWGPAVLRAVGVRAELSTRTLTDVVADPHSDDDEPVEGWSDYLAYLAEVLGPGAYVGEHTVVDDLDAVSDGAWAEVLRRLAADPHARSALLTPARSSSGSREAASYTAWWLREELGAPFAAEDAVAVAPFLPEPPGPVRGLEPAIQRALGAVEDLVDLDEDGWERYVELWPERGRLELPAAVLLWRALVRAARERVALPAPDVVPALDRTEARMLPADDVVVASPMWAQVRAVLPAPAGDVDLLATALDLDVAEDAAPTAEGARREAVPPAVHELLPSGPEHWTECASLRVDGIEVAWWVAPGEVYAATTTGLARGLAHAAGQWPDRFALEAVLAEPDRVGEAVAETAGDP